MATSNTQLREVAMSFISALSSLQIDKMIALRTPDCQQFILPSSLSRPPMSNNEFRAQYSKLLSAAEFADYKIKIHSIVVDEAQSKVVLHANGSATTIAGPFKSEYIFILTVESSGMISEVVEFVDSTLSAEEGSKIRTALEVGKE